MADADVAKLPTKADIGKFVIKTSSERLTAELICCQHVLEEDTVKQFSRAPLVEQVVPLRYLVGTTGPVKDPVSNFEPVEVDSDSEVSFGGQAPVSSIEQSQDQDLDQDVVQPVAPEKSVEVKPEVELFPQRNLIKLDCGNGVVDAILDTGADMSVFHPSMVRNTECDSGYSICLFGQ